MFGKKCNDNGEKLYRYSIRKYHFGAASVAVAALMFFANGAVKADTLPVSPVTANTEKVNAGVTGLTEGVPPKENLIEKSKEVESDKTPAAQKQVDKSPLVQAISELQAAIAKVDEESLLSLSNQLSQLTDENKRLLDGEDISQEALTRQVSRVQSLTEQVRQLKSKTEDKTSNKEDRADSKAQNTKELKVSDKAVTPTNQAEEIKAVQKDENKGEDTANKDKLEALSKSLITYLDTAKKIERPETKKLLEGVEEIVRSVENGLANPKLSASEIEELMKQGKQAEKKLVLAVTRENSGKRDTRNGNKMLPESYFRAPNTREGANTEFGNAYTAWMITNDDVRRFQSAGINDPNYHGYNYPVGTFLYNSNNAENSPINNNNMQGPQRIAWTRNRVYVQVNRVSGNEQTGYEFNWKIQFNNGHEPHQKPFYYFTLPDGHNFSSSVVLKENESQIATGTIEDVLEKSQGLLNGKMGTTEGVNGGEYYKGTGLINGRPYIQAPIRTLEDFVKNSTNYYFNRSGVNGDIIQKSDFLFENIRNSTKNIIAIQPQGRNPGGFNHSYSFEFTTHSNSADAPYYVAGVKTYETTLGLTQHRSYSQWGTLKDAYTIKTDSFTNGDFKKKTFLKGTQLGAFENSSYSFNSDAVSTVMGDRFIDAGLVLRNNTTGQDERPRKGGLLLKITPTATIDGSKYSHIHNFYNYNNPNDALTNSKDRTKGGHLAYLEGTYNGSTIKIPFSFNIVTQSDIFEPIKNEAKENQARKTTDNLGNATDFISGYNNISSRIPDLFTNWNEGNSDTFRNIFKGNSDTFPGSSNDIKNRAIKNVEWADGNSNLTGEKIVPVKVRYTPQGAAAYEETKYVTLPRELNNLSIGQVLTEAQKQKIIELAKTTFDVDSASFDGNTAKVGVKKQVKITYMDNEKNALTGNKDDSVRYVDFHFTNLTVPDSNKPVVTMNGRTLTTNAEENQFIIYRGAAFNPTFKVTDESRIGSLMVRNLPKGVYFNKVDNVDKERVGTTTVLNHTISGDDSNKVADDATLGEQIASVEASDQYGNRETYKFKYRIVDIQAKNSTTENRTVGSELGNSRNYFKVAESNTVNNTVNNDKYYPENIQFKWNEFDFIRFTEVPDNTKLNELGTITKYIATAVFPSTVNTKSIGGVNYTIYTPTKKAVPMTFNVTDTVAPTVKMTNPNNTDYTLGGSENGVPEIEVFRGATLNIPLKMHDNNVHGKINIKQISGLPAGVTLKDGNTVINNGNTLSKNSGSETNPATATITGKVAPNATLGTNVVTLKVSDDATGNVDRGNQATLKFKVKTYDLAFEDRGTRVDDNTRSDVLGLNTQSLDPNHYLAITDGRNVTNDWGSGMVFRYLKDNREIREHVSFDKIGKHSVKARAYFPNSKTSTQGLPTNPPGLTGDTASTNGRGFLEKTIEFNVKPNAPTIAQPQFYGTASSKPTVTVEGLPTSAQLQNGATVTVELYQGTTRVASKIVTDRSGTTTLSAENFTTNLTEGQQVYAVVKVSGGQGTTAYSVNSDNSENRNVTGRSTLSNLASNKLVVQVQDLTNNRRGTLSEAEKNTIKQAIFEANKNGVLRGKQASDITISDTGLITALDKDNKIAELQINPRTNVVTRFAYIRDDYNITYTNNGKPANRSTDPGFEWSQDRKSLIYKFDATSGVALQTNEVLKTITATPKNSQGQPSLTTVTGNDKALGEANSNGFSRNASTGYFSKNGVGVNVLDLVNPTSYGGGGNVDNTTNKLVENNRTDINNRNIVGTTLGSDSISAANSANAIPLTNVVKGQNGSSLVVKKQLYLMPKYTNDQLLQDRGNTNANNTNVINVYFVPVDPTAPQVERSTLNTLATTSAQAGRLADNTSFASLAKVTDNYDKDDVTNPSSNTVRNKLNMWVKKGDTKVQIVANGVENTAVINSLKKEIDPATYEVIAKTTDASGNKSHEDNSDGAKLGFFKVGYDLVAHETINVKQGERLTQDELNKLIQVQEGNTLQNLPQGATVTAALETSSIRSGSEEIKTVEATVDFGQGRTKKLNIRYRVLRTFPIANLVYDFYRQPRNDNELSYYTNTGLPQGMSWYVKKGTQTTNHGRIQELLRADGLGTTEYTFGAKYNAGRFTNRPEDDDKLKHEGRLVHKVFDVMLNPTKVTVDQGASLSDQQARDAVIKVANSENLPEGTTYEWVNASGVRENARATTSGEQTFHVKITLPKSQVTGSDLPGATQVQPSKIIPVTVNVTPPKPTFDTAPVTSTSRTITGTLGGLNASAGKAVVRVALNDGSGRVLTSENNGGVTINGNTWTATLPDDVKLRQSVQKNGENVKPANLTVTTTIAGTQLSRQGDDKVVQMGSYAITPAIAGSKHIDFTVPHDAKRVELRFHNNQETGDKSNSIVLVRGTDGWHTEATRTNSATVTNANGYVRTITSIPSTTNPAENNIRIALNEQSGTAKLHIKEENANGDNTDSYNKGLGLRVYTQPDAGQEPAATGKWKVASVTNTKPTLSYKGSEASSETARKVFPSGTSITKAMLENLVTVGDTEDKATNETDKPYGTPTVNIVSGLKETPGKATPAGRYTAVLKAVDSQGKESDPLTVYVGVVSTDVKYQPKVGGETKGTPITIDVPSGAHHQGETIPYTPKEITVGDKVYVPAEDGNKTVTLTDKPQTVEVAYKEKDASTEVKYQPKVGGETKGTPITIDVPSGAHHQGETIPYTPKEITVGDKVYVPAEDGNKTVTLTDKPQTVEVTYVEKPSTSTPTFTVGIQNPQTGNVEVTVDGIPEGTKVKLPGIASEKVVTGGKVELTHNELPVNPTTGRGIAQEDGKLPKEGTSDITIPGKLTSAKGEPAREFEVTIPLPIVVPDPEHLTPKEIEKLVDKVKESNPNTIVTADDKGNVTVTDKTTGDSVLIPAKDLTVKDFELVKPTDKVPVKDTAHLTPEEKKQVADKVKDKNPGKEVTVGDDGTATVTDPTTGISHTIPGTELVNQDFELVKPTDKVPVKDTAHLTPEEKKQVADKVKDKNPGKEVTVGDDG
ncbi:YSIRK-type signal peptide-containing protein, partial [Streptococcus sp. UMB0029]|uniref:YSIRK-type signal peptide-containing protein n=3 Tax=Lactobacillales TaxID=186826 RepID=UPI000CB060FE